MAAKLITHDQCTCTVALSPGEVDAGAELSVTVTVACPHARDLSGDIVSIVRHDDTEVKRAELRECDDATYSTGTIALQAPIAVGRHRYRAVLAAQGKNGIAHDTTSTATEFSFATVAHQTRVNVWAVPSAIAVGEHLRFNVGIACSSRCDLTGRTLVVLDHEGIQVAATSLGDTWPGTGALYFAEVEAKAPQVAGDYEWQVQVPETNAAAPHAAAACTFAMKVVPTAEHQVTIEAVDDDRQTPIEGLHVLLHPYRAATDANGTAKLGVAKGRYPLSVSGFNYNPYQDVIDVAGDLAVRVALTVESDEQDDYR